MHIQELTEADRPAVLQHLLNLSANDRRLRFFMSTSDNYIKHYVAEKMDFSNPNFGAFVGTDLIGLVSIAIVSPTSCELAFSINEEYRGTGLARNLMKMAVERCQELKLNKLCMSCLRENRKMQSLAKSFGLKLTIDFDEAYAELGITQ